jgi:hypothetical protein
MELGADSVTPPILAGGVSFLGKWTAKIHTIDGKLPAGSGSVFKIENKEIPVGLGQYGETSEIHMDPLTIASFKAKVQVQGSFPTTKPSQLSSVWHLSTIQSHKALRNNSLATPQSG